MSDLVLIRWTHTLSPARDVRLGSDSLVRLAKAISLLPSVGLYVPAQAVFNEAHSFYCSETKTNTKFYFVMLCGVCVCLLVITRTSKSVEKARK